MTTRLLPACIIYYVPVNINLADLERSLTTSMMTELSEQARKDFVKIQRITSRATNKPSLHCRILIDNQDEVDRLIAKGTLKVRRPIKDYDFKIEAPHRRKNPTRCYKCHRLDHIAKTCPFRRPLCRNCGLEHDFLTTPCKETPCCRNCNGNHPSNDPNCPAWKEQVESINHLVHR